MTSSPIRFDGQVAIITGAAGGIGSATAAMLHARGARLVLVDPALTPDGSRLALDVFCEQIGGGDVAVLNTSIGTPAAARSIVDVALARFGRIDMLFNNATTSAPGAIDAHDDSAVEAVMAVDLLGPYTLVRAVWPAMRAGGGGRILNVASAAALGTGVSGAYAIAKAGIFGLTCEASMAGAPVGIQVNTLVPQAATPLLDRHPDPAFRDWMTTRFPVSAVAAVSTFLLGNTHDLNGIALTAAGGRVAELVMAEGHGVFDPAMTPEMVAEDLPRIRDLHNAVPLRSLADQISLHSAVHGLPPTSR